MKDDLSFRVSFSIRFNELMMALGVTAYQLSRSILSSEALVSNIRNAKSVPGSDFLSKLLNYNEAININWLLTGNGNMMNSDITPRPKEKPMARLLTDEDLEERSRKVAKAAKEVAGIPLIPATAMAGITSGDVAIQDFEIEERYVIPILKDVDFLIRIDGDSMYPNYNNGDVVACRRVKEFNFVQWQKVYVLDTSQGPVIKRLAKGKDDNHLLCISDNKFYEPFEIKKDDIRGVALVVGGVWLE